jgi:hypothetical protein
MDTKLNKWVSALKRRDTIFRRAVLDNEAEIIDANTAQLEVGQDALGNLLDDYASTFYAEFKKAIGSNAPLGTPNLKLEGDFYAGFTLNVDGEQYFLTSTDEKAGDLAFKYGQDIFGLSEESLEKIRPLVLESFLILLRKEAA